MRGNCSRLARIGLVLLAMTLLLFPGAGARVAHAAAPALNAASSQWYPILVGSKFDPRNDRQAQDAVDLLGSTGFPLLYMYYDDKGDALGSNDELMLRVRVGEARDQQDRFSGYIWMGVDVDQDGDLDVFLMLEGKTGAYTLDVYSAGTGANNSPSTSSIANGVALATLTLNSTFRMDNVSSIDVGGTSFDGAAGKVDDFVSFTFNFQDFATRANAKPLTGGGGNIQSIDGGAGLTKTTPLRFVLASAQQTNSLNGDMGGYGSADNSSTTYAVQGAFSAPLTFGDPGGVETATALGFITAPRSVAAGQTSDMITVQLQNGQGAAVNSSGTTTVSLSGPNVTFLDVDAAGAVTSVDIPAGQSQVSFRAKSNVAGSPTITASASGVSSATQTLTVTPGPDVQLVFVTQPSDSFAGTAISPAVTVQVLDQYGNATASTATVSLTLGANPGGGSLSGNVSAAAAGGIATFSTLTVDKAGTGYTLSATAPGLTGATSAPFAISLRTLTLSGLTAQTREYDGTTAATIGSAGTLGGLVPGDDVSVDTSGATATFADKDAAAGKAVTVSGLGLTGAQAGYYSLNSTQTGTGTISPRAITVTADPVSKTAGDSDPPLTYQVTSGSLVAGESFTGALTRAPGETAGTYPITQGTLSAGSNYAITFAGADLTISPAPGATTLSVTGLTVDDKVYDGTTTAQVSTYGSLAGVTPGHAVSLVTTGASASFDTKDADTGKTVTVTGLALTGADAGLYTLGTVTGSADIAPRSVTVRADAKTKTVGTADPGLTYQITAGGLVAGESFTGALTRAPGETAGTYAITQGTLSVGSNYALTFEGADLTITPATVLSLSGLTAESRVYNGTTAASISDYGSLTGADPGHDVSLVTTGATATFDSKQVGTGKTVTVTGLTLTGADAALYSIGAQTATADITPKPVGLTGLSAADRQYDGTTQATVSSYGTLTGVEPGDDVTLETGGASAAFDTSAAGAGKTVTVTGLTLSGADSANYAIGVQTTTAAITPAPPPPEPEPFIPPPATGTVQVTVATDFGMAVPGIGVEIRGPDGQVVASGTTDSSGRVQVTLPAGSYTAALTLGGQNGAAAVTITGGQSAAVTLTVASNLLLGLLADPSAIVGDGRSTSRLSVSVQTLSGQPAGGVSVVLSATAGSVSPGAATTDEGGAAFATLTAPLMTGTSPRTEQVVATVFEPGRGLFGRDTITIRFMPASVTGVVIDARTGRPVAGAVVTASEDFDGDGTPDFTATVITGPDGRYEVVVPRGDWAYNLTIRTPLVVNGATVWVTSTQHSQINQVGGAGEQYQADPTISGLLQMRAGAGGQPKSLNEVLPSGVAVRGTIRNAAGELLDKPVTVAPDGTFQVASVPPGTYTVSFQVTAPDGTVLVGTSLQITVGGEGQLVLETGLIDPYGVVTDRVTGEPVKEVKMMLYWADHPTNTARGRTPHTLVALPVLATFPPGQNRVPQWTNAAGEYAWMVFPDGWYYLVAEREGYATYDSRVEGRNVPAAAGEDSFIQNGLIYVGSSIVQYNLSLDPLGGSPPGQNPPGEDPPGEEPPGEEPIPGEHVRYIRGYPDGEFKPERPITRAEVATILTRITGRIGPTDDAALYPDVSPSHWAVPYIKAARARGLMIGDPDGNFRPDAPISRAEVAMIALRFKSLQPASGAAFPDIAGHWAAETIGAVSRAGYMTGYPDGAFRPTQAITRAEFVTVINRLLERGPLLGRHAPTFPDVTTAHWAYGQVEEAGTSHGYVQQADRTERWVEDRFTEID